MANINVRKEEPSKLPVQSTAEDWEPARLMRQFFGWDPFREMMPMLRNDVTTFAPAFDVKETKDGYLFKADLPGINENDVEITLTGNRLNVSGKREAEKQEKSETYYTYERSYGSFARSFTLPDDVNAQNIHAELRDGVLTLHVPRKPEAVPRQIPLKSNAPKA
jgi:HSP20 family protein